MSPQNQTTQTERKHSPEFDRGVFAGGMGGAFFGVIGYMGWELVGAAAIFLVFWTLYFFHWFMIDLKGRSGVLYR